MRAAVASIAPPVYVEVCASDMKTKFGFLQSGSEYCGSKAREDRVSSSGLVGFGEQQPGDLWHASLARLSHAYVSPA